MAKKIYISIVMLYDYFYIENKKTMDNYLIP